MKNSQRLATTFKKVMQGVNFELSILVIKNPLTII